MNNDNINNNGMVYGFRSIYYEESTLIIK